MYILLVQHFSSIHGTVLVYVQCTCTCTQLTSSGTALMLVKPLRKTTNTRRAPQRRAEVAQSNAVSPAPRTIALPWRSGRVLLQAHIPAQREREREREGGEGRKGDLTIGTKNSSDILGTAQKGRIT